MRTPTKTAAWGAKPDPNKKAVAAPRLNPGQDPIDALIKRQQGSEASSKSDPIKHISLNMGDKLHKRLKTYCVAHDTNVSEIVSKLAEAFLAENE